MINGPEGSRAKTQVSVTPKGKYTLRLARRASGDKSEESVPVGGCTGAQVCL